MSQAPRSRVSQKKKEMLKRRKKRLRQLRRISLLAVCAIVLIVAAITAVTKLTSPKQTTLEQNRLADSLSEQTEASLSLKYEPASVSLLAVGDNLIHNTLLSDAQQSDGSYNFIPFYSDIRKYVTSADIALVNQESPLGTGEPAGYPSFNTPQACGDALIDTGFDVISHANNHAMDSGSDALYDTLDYWDSHAGDGVIRVGIARDADDRKTVRYLERNGLKIGFLAYTYGLNGNSLPSDNPDLVSLIDKDKIAEEVAAVKAECDAVVVMMHWGEEYQLKENDEQDSLAKFLAEQGVNLIIGGHPHVCEPCAWIEADNGNKAFCIYSTGNFISAQDKASTMVEAMLQVTLTRQEDGTIVVENPGVMPMVCYFNSSWRGYRVLPMDEYTDAMASSHGLAGSCDMSVSNLRSIAEEVFGDFLIGKTIPSTASTAADSAQPTEAIQNTD